MKNHLDFSINGGLSAAFYTLGCRVNQYETDSIEEQFRCAGFEIRSFDDPCDVYVINTCTVTAESDRKSRQIVRRTLGVKKENSVVIVCGCYSQKCPDEILMIDGVDIVLGNTRKNEICKIATEALKGKIIRKNFAEDINLSREYEDTHISKSERTRAFIKICDGCENNCTYCIIPSVRGKVRSRREADILREISDLANAGYREFVLTGIETAAYGKEANNKYALISLIEKVAEIQRVARIRLGSMEPSVFSEEFIIRLSKISKLMPHFHLSLQSGSDEILRLMKRKYNTKKFIDVTENLKKYIPGVELTTDIIVGFPGETEELYIKTEEFAKKCCFSHIHIFPYSGREGTIAAGLPYQLDKKTKKDRVERLESVSQKIREKILKNYIGTVQNVLMETYDRKTIDGYTESYIKVLLDTDTDFCGKIIPVEIIGTAYDKDGTLCLVGKNYSAM